MTTAEAPRQVASGPGDSGRGSPAVREWPRHRGRASSALGGGGAAVGPDSPAVGTSSRRFPVLLQLVAKPGRKDSLALQVDGKPSQTSRLAFPAAGKSSRETSEPIQAAAGRSQVLALASPTAGQSSRPVEVLFEVVGEASRKNRSAPPVVGKSSQKTSASIQVIGTSSKALADAFSARGPSSRVFEDALPSGSGTMQSWARRVRESRKGKQTEDEPGIPERPFRVMGGRQFATEEQLVFSPLPCWAHLPEAEYQRRAADLIEEGALERKRTGKRSLGVERILKADPHHRPEKVEKSPKPRFHALAPEVFELLWQTWSEVIAAFREASARLLSGEREVEFPEGTFPPHLPFISFAETLTIQARGQPA